MTTCGIVLRGDGAAGFNAGPERWTVPVWDASSIIQHGLGDLLAHKGSMTWLDAPH
jgi:hypothetical protein